MLELEAFEILQFWNVNGMTMTSFKRHVLKKKIQTEFIQMFREPVKFLVKLVYNNVHTYCNFDVAELRIYWQLAKNGRGQIMSPAERGGRGGFFPPQPMKRGLRPEPAAIVAELRCIFEMLFYVTTPRVTFISSVSYFSPQ